MEYKQIPPPSVEIIQKFVADSPVISRPLLAPCIVGPCNSVISPTTDTGAINSDARCTLPAVMTATNAGPYTNLGNSKFYIKYKEYPAVEITFNPLPSAPSAAQAASQINETIGLTGVHARAVTYGENSYVQLYTLNRGKGEFFKVLPGVGEDSLAILGFDKPNYAAYGVTYYNNDSVTAPFRFFPDPYGLLAEDDLEIIDSSVRAFILSGTTLQEAKRDETVSRWDEEVEVTGNVDITALTYPGDIMDLELPITRHGEDEKTCILGSSNREVIVGVVNDLLAKLDAHIKNDAIHPVNDTFNILSTTAISIHATMAQIGAAITEFIAVYNAHDANIGEVFHTDGSGHLIGTLPVTTWTEIITACNTCKDEFGAHVENASDYHNATGVEHAPTFMSIYTYNKASEAYTNHIMNRPGRPNYHPDAGTDYLAMPSLWPTAAYNVVQTAWNDFKLKYNAHDANSTLHTVGDTSGITAEDATNFAELLLLVTDALTQLNAHLMHVSEHIVQDTTNAALLHQLEIDVVAFDHLYLISDINAIWPGLASLSTDFLHLSTNNGGLIIGEGSGVAVVGLTPGQILYVLEVIDDGDSDTTSPYVQINGPSLTAVAAVATATGTVDITTLTYPTDVDGKILEVGEGSSKQLIQFDSTVDSYTTLLSKINDVMGSGFASEVDNNLRFTSINYGHDGRIALGAPPPIESAHDVLLGPAVTYENANFYGTPYPVVANDELWADGEKLGTIVEVAPGGHTDRLRLDTELSKDRVWSNAYIRAKNLSSTYADRPLPDLIVGNEALLKHDQLRSHRGIPDKSNAGIYVGYRGLRLDVSTNTKKPSLVIVEDINELDELLGPISADNPLGLAMSFALANAPNITIAGLGVESVSTSMPQGTYYAYQQALTLLESNAVYSLVPLTYENSVHQAFHLHCQELSEVGKERICFINPLFPFRAHPKTVVSGTEGETISDTIFETNTSGISAALMAMGLDPTGGFIANDGVYLDISGTDLNYNISAIDGSQVHLRLTFGYGDNTDYFYTTEALPSTLLNQPFSVRIRGHEITSKTEQARAYADLGSSYGSRRTYMVVPDNATAVVGDFEMSIPGYYVASAIAGQVGQQPPQQGLSNMPIIGFTGVSWSSDYFTDIQLDTIAGGGGYIIYQPEQGSLLMSRHQLSTDTSDIKKMELSITKAVDFSAKFLRLSIKSIAGRYIIDDEFMDMVGMVVNGSCAWLVEEAGVLLGATIDELRPSATRADGLELIIDFEVGIPGNHIKITLLI